MGMWAAGVVFFREEIFESFIFYLSTLQKPLVPTSGSRGIGCSGVNRI